MSRPSSPDRARGVSVASLALVLALMAPAIASGQPEPPAQPGVVSRPLGSVEASVGPGVATLTPRTFAIPSDSGYHFTARVRVPKDTSSVQMRFKVLNPSGKLMLQRTRIQSTISTGQATAVFERDISDLGLSAGSYPVQLEVRVASKGQIAEATLESELLVYDPKGPSVPVVWALRITGQPLADPRGTFVADPARFTRARDDARAVASWVLGTPDAKVTLALSPLLLEEWKRISGGYRLTGPEGETAVPASEPVPVAYAAALTTIRRALDTGRLELTHLGYTDPNLSDLSTQKLAADVSPQYAQGISAMFASLETTPSTGTVVAGGCIPPDTIDRLIEEGVGYGIVDPSCTRSGAATASPGAYRVKGERLVALVTDRPAERALARGDHDAVAEVAFERRVNAVSAPLVIRGELGPGRLTFTSFSETARVLAEQPWVTPSLAREAAGKRARRTLTLHVGRGSAKTPAGYWDDVRAGRDWARALEAGLGADAAETVTARRDSLVAECSAWAGPANDWALADRGRAFAQSSTRLAKSVFDPVRLTVQPVTLAGSHGEVPVTISNESGSVLALRLTAVPSREVRLSGKRSSVMEVLPKDNFLELPVDLQDALSGNISVTLSAGGVVLERESVTVRASYLDRLVMFLGAVLVLGVLLAFIIKRVRAAESAGTNNSDGARRSKPERPGSES